MSYRNKTYVAFASEDIRSYRLMEAWRDNEKFEFDFYDAHDLFISRDTSKPETIKRNLRERLKNAKQIILLGSETARKKGSDGNSFLAHEIEVIIEFDLPVVVANIDGSRHGLNKFIPQPLIDEKYHTMSVSFQPKVIMYSLDNYAANYKKKNRIGGHHYLSSVYDNLGL
jgi:hypothetical protein